MKFEAGMRVAKVSHFSGHTPTEAFIEKVYANGNFILKGDLTKKQWRPYCERQAERVGETSHYATTIVVWDEAFDKSVAKERVLKEHNHCAYELETKIKSMQLRFLSSPDLLELKALIDRLTTSKEI